MAISKDQIKKAFVSDPKDIGEYVYNNQDWYQEDAQRMRYILVTRNMSTLTKKKKMQSRHFSKNTLKSQK